MDSKELLKTAALYFRDTHPGLTPESVLCFLVLADFAPSSMPLNQLAQALNYAPGDAKSHLIPLAGAGLIMIDVVGRVQLTPAGDASRRSLEQRFAQSTHSAA